MTAVTGGRVFLIVKRLTLSGGYHARLQAVLVAALLFALAACAPTNPAFPAGGVPAGTPSSAPDAGEPSSLPIPSASPQPAKETPTDVPNSVNPAAQPEAPRPYYNLTAALNYDQHLLVVDEQIRYPNTSGEALSDLLLMVEPLYYPGVFTLNAMAWEDGTAISEYTREGSRLRIPLAQPLAPGESLALTISYELSLPSPTPSPETRPVPFGYSARQANLVDWYPFIPPYVPGVGWLAHGAGFFGEHLAYPVADFEVSLHLGERPGLQVAASSPAESGDDGWIRYRHDNARNFAFSVSDQYKVERTTVDGIEVVSYAFSFHGQAGQAALDATAKALALYNEIYAPYPHSMLSLVEADFLDGMEYDGLYFLSNGFYNLYQGQPGEYLVAIAAHETAHQWFYALVGNDQALEPWLDEALCTYSERLFYERYYPDTLDWWWTYRVNYYDPQGPVNGSIYNPGGYRAYRDAVYLNGAIFLEELRKRVGDEAFFAFLKDYLSLYAHQISTADSFFATLRKHTSFDFSDLVVRFLD